MLQNQAKIQKRGLIFRIQDSGLSPSENSLVCDPQHRILNSGFFFKCLLLCQQVFRAFLAFVSTRGAGLCVQAILLYIQPTGGREFTTNLFSTVVIQQKLQRFVFLCQCQYRPTFFEYNFQSMAKTATITTAGTRANSAFCLHADTIIMNTHFYILSSSSLAFVGQ